MFAELRVFACGRCTCLKDVTAGLLNQIQIKKCSSFILVQRILGGYNSLTELEFLHCCCMSLCNRQAAEFEESPEMSCSQERGGHEVTVTLKEKGLLCWI